MFSSRRITLGGDVFRDEYSLAFDGTDDYIAINGFASSDVLAEDDAWTLGFWFKSSQTDSGEASEIIFSVNTSSHSNVISIGVNANSTGANVNGGIFYSDGRISNDVCLTDNDDPDDGTQYTDGQWHQAIITRPSGAGMQNSECYVNGKLQGYSWQTSDGTLHNSGQFHTDPAWGSGELASIGQEWDSGPSVTDFFKGSISELFVYNKHMTQSQVKILYNGREPYNHKEGIASGNLKAWWRMGDAQTPKVQNSNKNLPFLVLDQTDKKREIMKAWDFSSGVDGWGDYSGNTTEHSTAITNHSGGSGVLKCIGADGSDYWLGKSDALTDPGIEADKHYAIEYHMYVPSSWSGTTELMVQEASMSSKNYSQGIHRIDEAIKDTWQYGLEIFSPSSADLSGFLYPRSLNTNDVEADDFVYISGVTLFEYINKNHGRPVNMNVSLSFSGDTP